MPPFAPRPRMICRLVRTFHPAPPTPDSRRASRHVAHCADCAAFYATTAKLDHALRTSATDLTPPPAIPAGLEQRIWAAVEPGVRARRQPRRARVSGGWGLLAGGLAAMALVFWATTRSDDSAGPTDSGIAEFSPADIAALTDSVRTFSTKLFAPSLVENEPIPGGLDQELAALRNDTNAALQFLQANLFLAPDQSS